MSNALENHEAGAGRVRNVAGSLVKDNFVGGRTNRAWAGLALLVLGVILAHLALVRFTAVRPLHGDENLYHHSAHSYSRSGLTSVLPGRLKFEHRPSLPTHILSNLASREGEVRSPELIESFRYRVTRLNLILLLAVVGSTAWQTGALRRSTAAMVIAGGLLALFPWFGYYVHALWPELLHASCVGLGLALLCQFFNGRRLWLLIAAGIALGYALLLKGSLNLFLPAAVALVGLEAARSQSRAGPRPWIRGLRAAALFGGAALLVLLPQLMVNHQRGVGFRIAANKWRNIEWGLTLPTSSDSTRATAWRRASERYRIPRSLVEREQAARGRALEIVAEQGMWRTLSAQAARLIWLLVRSEPSFERVPLVETLGDPGVMPGWWQALRLSARVMWFSILAFSLVGALACGWRSPGGRLLSLYLAYLLLALLVVPSKLRFAMPAVPVMCVFAGLALGSLVDRLGSKS